MSVTSAIVEPVLNFSGVPAYALVGGLAFGEAALFFGFLLPGETAVILGGVLAYRHSVSLTTMALVVVAAAILGGEVSMGAAIASQEFVGAHERYGRNRPK